MKTRLYGLDLLRILCALIVYCFHSIIHMGHNYGFLSSYMKDSPVIMILFFMISGFALYYQYHSTKLMDMSNLKPFYIKKAADLIPLYWFLILIYEPIYKTMPWKRYLFLLPTEFLGQQSIYDQINSFSHNPGSWFISCLIFCLFFSPFFNDLISQLDKKTRISSLIILSSLCVYAQILAKIYTTYIVFSNVVFRLFEYIIGMLICSLYLETKQEENNLYLLPTFITGVFYVFSISLLHNAQIGNYHIYNFIAIPCSIIFLWCSLFIRVKPNTFFTSVISHLNKLVYPFYIAQFFVWDFAISLLDNLPFDLPNFMDIIITLSLCYLITLILYNVIYVPCKKWIHKKLLR